ncbi:MAG: hypothetical protein ISS16_01380 [Ignavibacteria bacterium]|nr:hypothetical protein [Ignavibacteria bacterium]
MNVKLTLKLSKEAIDKAKSYANNTNESLSSLVEKYFRLISSKMNTKDFEISQNVLELSGIIKLDKKFDLKKEYRKHIIEKYD